MSETLPTPYPELNTVLRELVDRLQAALGDNFVGAYLQGSFAVGDFDQDSDCDFIVVVNDGTFSARRSICCRAFMPRIFDLDIRLGEASGRA